LKVTRDSLFSTQGDNYTIMFVPRRDIEIIDQVIKEMNSA